jgi:Cu-Zn family superoxide dismutase
MRRSTRILAAGFAALLIGTGTATAQELSVDVHRISDTGIGDKIGTIVLSERRGGLFLKVSVKGLPQGRRGFHVHANGDCGPAMKDGKMTAGLAAGGHFDPEGKKTHAGPRGEGHKGDLTALHGSDKGISQMVLTRRLKLADVRGRSLVIHEGGDNYTDDPENGGGKGRVACAVVPKP